MGWLRAGGMGVFFLVWGGQWLSWLGSGLSSFALGIWMYERTGSPTQFALTVLAITLPRMLLAPVAGPLVDRWDRRLVMLASDSGAALVTLVLALLLWAEQLAVWHIYLGMLLSAACGTFQRPAYAASVTLLVPTAQYGRANGLINFARSSADLAAPLLAGYLTLWLGLAPLLLLDVATFLVAAATLLLVRFPPTPPAPTTAGQPSLLREARDGWRYLRQRPGLFGLLLYTGAANFLGITTEVLLTPYLLAFSSADVVGWVASLSGAGLLAGGLLLSVWGGPAQRVRGVFGFELLVCCCMLVIGLTSSPWLIGAAVFVYFVAIGLSDGCATVLWQTQVAPDFQGRVFALRDMVGFAALPLGLLLSAPLAEFVFEPLLQPGGAWAGSLGQLIGTGPGRGIGLLFVLAGLFNLLVIGLAWRNPCIRYIDE
ncbi:MAG: MFS transporter [Chloroflexaceae bacterium]|nr:MFS transporter [Chloroflexaceae bacterium]